MSTRWQDLYGTQFTVNSDIDPDFSVMGYIDNYVEDDMAFKALCEILEYLVANSPNDIQVIEPDDLNFDVTYRGPAGFSLLLSQLSTNGPAAFLIASYVFTNSAVPVASKYQNLVFERLLMILETLISMYYYGNPLVVQAVSSILDPSAI